jgi:hypothetical protein
MAVNWGMGATLVESAENTVNDVRKLYSAFVETDLGSKKERPMALNPALPASYPKFEVLHSASYDWLQIQRVVGEADGRLRV